MTKILLVEDHEELWDFLSRRLTRRGFEVVLAHDGQQGVEKAVTEQPDVILLDMNLPVMDGWAAARTLRGQESTARIPIIALTAHAMSGDRGKVIEAGCDEYITKPFEVDEIQRTVSQLLLSTV